MIIQLNSYSFPCKRNNNNNNNQNLGRDAPRPLHDLPHKLLRNTNASFVRKYEN
jgi:hypothetical protein